MASSSLLHPPPAASLAFCGGGGAKSLRMLSPRRSSVTMRERAKNRKPLQRGRYLSLEAIQAIQALKRTGPGSIDRVMRSKVRRLVKFDMMAVLTELQAQDEAFLALQIFEEIRGEHWYTPRFSLYADMVRVLATNELLEEVEFVCSRLKTERFAQADVDGFNSLLGTFLQFGFVQDAVDCFLSMDTWGLEPDESTFRILIHGLESKGEGGTSALVREEAMKCFGGSLEFMEEMQENGIPMHQNCSLD